MTSPPDDAPGLTGGGVTFLEGLTISAAGGPSLHGWVPRYSPLIIQNAI